jgi:hypothetical protein
MTALERSLNVIRKNNLLDIGVRDVLGNNLPHVLISRSGFEMIDQSIGQFGNSGLFYGGGWAMDNLLDKLFNLFALKRTASQQQWYVAGKSVSLYSFLATLMLACAQVKNQIVSRLSKTLNYTDMIGETQGQTDLSNTVAEEKAYITKAKRIVLSGFTTTLLTALGAGMCIKMGLPIPAWLQKVGKHLFLGNGQFAKMPDIGDALCGAGAA